MQKGDLKPMIARTRVPLHLIHQGPSPGSLPAHPMDCAQEREHL
jgi:hypothetical protein